MQLVSGQNVALAVTRLRVTVRGPVDLTALILSADAKVTGDEDMVFFNQPTAPGVRLDGATVDIDLNALRRGAERLVLVASASDQVSTFGQLPPLTVILQQPGNDISYTPVGVSSETALVLCELYVRDGQWKARAVGAGYDTGWRESPPTTACR